MSIIMMRSSKNPYRDVHIIDFTCDQENLVGKHGRKVKTMP